MNDLIITTKFETASKPLNKALNGIVTEMNKGVKAGENIAKYLTDIYDGELWKDTEYASFSDIAGIFNIGKQQAYKLVKAYTLKYKTDGLEERLAPFTISQITELERLLPSDIMVLVDDGDVKPDMTLKAIREVVDAYKKEDLDAESVDDGEDHDGGEELEIGDKLPVDAVVISYKGNEIKIEDTAHIKKLFDYLKKGGYTMKGSEN